MPRETDAAAPREILYVEDHPTNVQLMQALFRRRPDLELIVATDGAEALRLAEHIHPSLLMLDLRLPDCYGVALLEQLREFDGWAHIPAVAVTAEPDFRPDQTAFSEVWAKPLDLAFVLQRLDHFSVPAPSPPPVNSVSLQTALPESAG